MELKVEDIIEFIRECEPDFQYSNNRNKYGMFTIGTQHIYADSIEELLEIGINRYKEYGNKSTFRMIIEGDI